MNQRKGIGNKDAHQKTKPPATPAPAETAPRPLQASAQSYTQPFARCDAAATRGRGWLFGGEGMPRRGLHIVVCRGGLGEGRAVCSHAVQILSY